MTRPKEADYQSQAAYTRDLEEYCDALEQSSEQEPVVWLDEEKKIIYWHNTHPVSDYHGFKRTTPLYRKPQEAPRKPLTDEEICNLWSWSMTAEAERTASTQQHAFARAIEAAHGIGEKE